MNGGLAMTKFAYDKTGFPMIYVDEVEGYVHWQPVTKVQFETFICDAPVSKFDEAWYDDILKLNKRISSRQVNGSNFWQLFITGIKPEEVEDFAAWCGEDYQIPTSEEWKKIYNRFSKTPANPDILKDFKLGRRSQAILAKLEEINCTRIPSSERKMSDQMVMRFGVMEWVRLIDYRQDWGGMGQPIGGLQPTIQPPEKGPELLRNPSTSRYHYYGFRLIKKG
jgi:hypothetical protein